MSYGEKTPYNISRLTLEKGELRTMIRSDGEIPSLERITMKQKNLLSNSTTYKDFRLLYGDALLESYSACQNGPENYKGTLTMQVVIRRLFKNDKNKSLKRAFIMPFFIHKELDQEIINTRNLTTTSKMAQHYLPQT